jgi:uncharacterized membrane protein
MAHSTSSELLEIEPGSSVVEPETRMSTHGTPLWAVIMATLSVFIAFDAVSPAGVYPAVVALLCGITLFGLGYTVLRFFALHDRDADLLLVSPAAGLIAACAAAYLAATYGVGLGIVFFGIAALALPGLWMAVGVLKRCWRNPVPNGMVISGLIIAIALIYFLP